MAWPAHRTGGWKPTGLRPGQGPGGTMQKLQEPPGKTGGRAPFHLLVFCRCCSRQNHGETVLRVCVIVLCCSCVGPVLTFCVVCRCLQHVLRVMCVRCLRVCVRLRDCGGDRMCAERVGRQGLPCGWWRWAACGRRWGGGAGSRYWMWGLGGGGLGQPAPGCSLVQLSCSAPGAPRGQWPSHTHGSTGSRLSVREPEHPGLRAPPARGAARESPHVRPLTALAPPPAACGSGQGVSLSVKGVSSPLAAWGPGRSSQGPRHRWCCSGGSPGIASNRPGCPPPHLARPG